MMRTMRMRLVCIMMRVPMLVRDYMLTRIVVPMGPITLGMCVA